MFLAIELQGEQWSRTDLAAIVRELNRRFKEKFAKERLKHPRVAKDSLRELPDCYKIKITTPQFRLIYHVNDTKRLLTILSVASRDDVYEELQSRL